MLRRAGTGALELWTEADMSASGYEPRRAPMVRVQDPVTGIGHYVAGPVLPKNKQPKPPAIETVDVGFGGGSSKAINLIKRVRRVSLDKRRRLYALDIKIAKLQRDRAAVILATWGDGEILELADVEAIVRSPREKRGPSRRTVGQRLDSINDAFPPEAIAKAYKQSGGWCNLHNDRKVEGCPGCVR